MAAMLIVIVGMTTLYFRRAPAPEGSPAVSRLSVALVLPGIHPIEFLVGAFDVAIDRHM
jgi:hypothetical protein